MVQKIVLLIAVLLSYPFASTVVLAADDTPGLIQLQGLFARAVVVTGAAIFLALTVMLVVAGIKFLTSGGEPKQIQNASLTLTWAILGIVFLVLAWLFLRLIASFTGATQVLNFDILSVFPSAKP